MQRLKNRKGFSLAETLLAVLILLLVSVIMVNGVPAAKNAYYKVILGANAQSALSTVAAALRDELGTAWDVKVEGTTITYVNADSGIRGQIGVSSAEGGSGQSTIRVTELKDSYSFVENTSEETVAGQVYDLLPASALTDGMQLSYTSVTPPDANKVIVIGNLQITKDGQELASLENLAIEVLSVGTESISQPAAGTGSGLTNQP